MIKKTEINESKINDFIKNSEWPTCFDTKSSWQLMTKKVVIRPSIKLQSEANKIFKLDIKWKKKQINLRDACKESFKKYTQNLDLQCTQDTSKFYKIINSLIRYKTRGKIAKGITQGDEIRLGEEKNEVIIHYFKQLYNGPKVPYSGESNGIFDFRVDARRGLERWATNKAAGIDEIHGEFYKNIRIRDILIEILQKHFIE